MSIFALIAERRIQEAIQKGLLDNLSLKGKPIAQEDLSAVPEELRMGYKILKNAGYLPEELQLKKEILALGDLLKTCENPEEKASTRRRITQRQLQLDMLMEKKERSLAWQEYQDKLERKLSKEVKG